MDNMVCGKRADGESRAGGVSVVRWGCPLLNPVFGNCPYGE